MIASGVLGGTLTSLSNGRRPERPPRCAPPSARRSASASWPPGAGPWRWILSGGKIFLLPEAGRRLDMGSGVVPDGLRVGARHMAGIRRHWQAGNDRHMAGELPVLFSRAHGVAATGADTSAARLLRPAETGLVRAPGRVTICALAFMRTCTGIRWTWQRRDVHPPGGNLRRVAYVRWAPTGWRRPACVCSRRHGSDYRARGEGNGGKRGAGR